MGGAVILLVIGAVLLVAAGGLRLCLGPSPREEPVALAPVPVAATGAVPNARFVWAFPVLFVGLFAVCGVCFFLLPLNSIDPRAPAYQRPLLDVLNDPRASRPFVLFVVGVGSFLLLPVVAIYGNPVRGIAAPWEPGGRAWSAGGRSIHGLLLAVVVVGAVGAVAWFAAALGVLAAVVGFIAWLGWLQRSWIVIDDVGVIWSGFRFRWDQVTSWAVVYHPYNGSGDDCGGESYELVVELAGGTKLTRDDVWPPRRLSEFFAEHIPERGTGSAV